VRRRLAPPPSALAAPGVPRHGRSYPYPRDADGDDYDGEITKALRELNVDSNTVGWYVTTYMGSYCTKETVSRQFKFQEALPNRYAGLRRPRWRAYSRLRRTLRADGSPLPRSIMLVYDSVRTGQGHLSIKALRLKAPFMEAFRKRVASDMCVACRVARRRCLLAHVAYVHSFATAPSCPPAGSAPSPPPRSLKSCP